MTAANTEVCSKVQKPRITTLQLFFGYCESERMAGVVIARVGTKGFKTAKGALRCFIRDCKRIIQVQSQPAQSTKSCCTKSKAKDDARYCPKCGSYLKGEPKEPDLEEIAEWARDLDSTIDGVGFEIEEALKSHGWEIGMSRAGDWVVVHGMDYLIKGEYPSCWSVMRMTVGKTRHITNQKSEDFSF